MGCLLLQLCISRRGGNVSVNLTEWPASLKFRWCLRLPDAAPCVERSFYIQATVLFRAKRVLRMTRIPILFASNWLVRHQPRQLDAGALRLNNYSLLWRRAIPCLNIKPSFDAGNCVNPGSGRRRNHCNFDWRRPHSQFDRDIFLRVTFMGWNASTTRILNVFIKLYLY